MSTDEIVIAGYAETEIKVRGGRSAYELAGEVLESLLEKSGLDKAQIDGMSVSNSLSEQGNAFYPIFMTEALGITPTWLISGAIGGCSPLAGVARAASAIREGQCRIAVVISADAPSKTGMSKPTAFRPEFQEPVGVKGPPATFGLLMSRYAHQWGLSDEALGKIAVTQRGHAVLNANALEKFRTPLSMDDYLASRMIAAPLRMLDSVMPCDGANAVLVMSETTAANLGLHKKARIGHYAEITNVQGNAATPDITLNGFAYVAKTLWDRSGLGPRDITHFQPYDDFTIAVLMQMEEFGFCKKGAGCRFILETDLTHQGTLPLNTGGGQISAGQPGLAGGGIQVVEAVRQIFGEGGERQVSNAKRALVTGIGGVLYGRNWSSSAAMILEA